MLEAANKFLVFAQQAPTPFHAVRQAATRLEGAGFRKIKESEHWNHTLGEGKYYYTRNQSSLVAFTIPQKWSPGSGFSVVATHVDSPNLRLRSASKRTKEGYLQVAVETYGGGIWHSWFDRDLSVAGRIIARNNDSETSNTGPYAQGFKTRLVDLKAPIIRIPTLAIHLDRSVNEAFKFNAETEMTPVLGLVSASLNTPANVASQNTSDTADYAATSHHPQLISLLAETDPDLKPDDILDFELHLYDTQPPSLGGAHQEFIFSPRLDNLMSVFCAIESIVQSPSPAGDHVNVAALFNHEEIGSVSNTGAESSLLEDLISRLSPTSADRAQSIANSLALSADMTHAVHPNYASKHQDEHRPKMNNGVVVKMNAKQRYATESVGAFLVAQMAKARGRSVQQFESRNDSPCGSTVGPMLSKLGLRTVDIGLAQLSMHSIREMCGSQDVDAYIDLFNEFYESFGRLSKQLVIE